MATVSKTQYKLKSDEQERLRGRYSHMDILKQAQMAKKNFGNKAHKIKQGMYLQSVGKIPDYTEQEDAKQFDSEIVESYLQVAVLYESLEDLLDKREDFSIIEDDMGPTLEKMMREGRKVSYANLVSACEKFNKERPDVMKLHLEKSQQSCEYFLDRNIPKDEAKSFALAIAFYTGAYSAAINADATLLARRILVTEDLLNDDGAFDTDALLIMYYLIQGLSHIDFYWGVCVRYITLDEKELKDYQPGEIVTWLQFSSSDKGGKDMSHFTDRNTKFIIASLTGRPIQYFSNCADDEDEVLFLPHSSFLVCHVTKDKKINQNHIYLRQVSRP